ncbi:MAG: MgtC/SapB family protein, partial [Hyphomicrobiales bacterium]|nr:MgtC/SapB family protein [Hyphomicrobiales bacterium]
IGLNAGGGVVGLVFLGFTSAFTAFHWLEAKAEGNVSVTSVVAGMLTFLLGAMAVMGEQLAAIAGAVALTGVLALREALHRWVASLTWQEIRAVLILLAMSFLLLPVLPDRTIDPWGTINPYEIWLLAILIAGISFSGYVAVRLFGDRLGVVMAALAGGLASSTATTLTFARLAKEHPASGRLLAAGILIAGFVMVVRGGIVAVALNRALLPLLVAPLGISALVLSVGAALLLLWNTELENPELKVSNPLALGTALKLAAFIAIVMLAADLVRRAFGDVGVLVVAAVSGIADVDAVTISMAKLGGASLSLGIVAQAIVTAVAVNTISKAVMAAWVGGKTVAAPILSISAVAVLGLGAGLFLA